MLYYQSSKHMGAQHMWLLLCRAPTSVRRHYWRHWAWRHSSASWR